MSDRASGMTGSDRLPLVAAYLLYLIGLTHGLTILIALVIAYGQRKTAGPVLVSHYNWLIRTFWLSIGWFLLGALIVLVSLPLVLVGIGLIGVWAGLTLCGIIWLWALVRLVLGLVHLARDEAYPRPMSWTI